MMVAVSCDVQSWRVLSAREQETLESEPYDRWITGSDGVMAEFHRLPDGFLVRFPDEADFRILNDCQQIEAIPVPNLDLRELERLFRNAITPIIGNHSGGLFLHGSAVLIGDRAAAFLGPSRSGKTTLAAAFAKAGHPFLTEDVIDIADVSGQYWLRPKYSALRLFADSARFMLGESEMAISDDVKVDVEGGAGFPFAPQPARLQHIFILGANREAPLRIEPVAGLSALLPHAFVLDVEDRDRLRAHFARLAELSDAVPCASLDYTRSYAELDAVVETVMEHLQTANDQRWS